MTDIEREIQKNFYVDMENTFWQMIENKLIWYFQEYQDSTFTPDIMASIFSDMMKNNAFRLAEEMKNECNY